MPTFSRCASACLWALILSVAPITWTASVFEAAAWLNCIQSPLSAAWRECAMGAKCRFGEMSGLLSSWQSTPEIMPSPLILAHLIMWAVLFPAGLIVFERHTLLRDDDASPSEPCFYCSEVHLSPGFLIRTANHRSSFQLDAHTHT